MYIYKYQVESTKEMKKENKLKLSQDENNLYSLHMHICLNQAQQERWVKKFYTPFAQVIPD